MADPGQVYHNSGAPPLIYYMGKEYIGGSVSYDRTIPVTTQGYLENSGENEISESVDTIDNIPGDEE